MEEVEAEPIQQIDPLLTKNIWELEQRISGGKADATTRLLLMRAYAQQVEAVEDALGVPPDRRAYLHVEERSRDGVLLLHGASGSPAQLRTLGDALHEAGFTVYGARLAGHGLTEPDKVRTQWRACVRDAQVRYRVLSTWCQRLYVVGFSYGAAVALHLDAEPRARGLVLLAPALFPKTSGLVGLLMSLGLGRTSWLRNRLGWTPDGLEAMDSARNQAWWHEVPVLAVAADDDPRIGPKSLTWVRTQSKHTATEITRYKSGGHVFMDGPHHDELIAATVTFLKRN